MKKQFYLEFYRVLWSFAPTPLKGAFSLYVFSPPSGGMGGEFNGSFQGVFIKNLLIICNYNVITSSNSMKL